MKFPDPFYKYRPHPWHGLEVGKAPPLRVHAYIELTPFDSIKYEIDKSTGYLRVDRPQRTSSHPPTLYGFIPRTLSGRRVSKFSTSCDKGDGDPLDICVISERPINRVEVILNVKVIGGMRMNDNGEADDKIIGVLENDDVWRNAEKLSDLPTALVDRLRHYFSTYKLTPGTETHQYIEEIYDNDTALKVVEAAIADYEDAFAS